MALGHVGHWTGPNYVLIDLMLIANSGNFELRKRKMSEVTPLWCVRDHVHLTREGYKDIADTVLDCSFEQIGSELSSVTGTSTSTTGVWNKRKTIKRVVTMPKERPKAKKSRLHTMMSEEEEEGGHTVMSSRGEGGGEATGWDKPDGRDGREEVDGLAGSEKTKTMDKCGTNFSFPLSILFSLLSNHILTRVLLFF
jgi:hypothetical protein